MNDEITIDGVVYVRKDSCKCPFMNKEKENISAKYGFTRETINYNGHILHRIIALKDFGKVTKGDIGGWIENENNLSQKGDCWVYDDATVYGNAEVRDNAVLFNLADVFEDAVVFENAEVYGNAEVFGHSRVYGNAEVFGNTKVFENAKVFGHANVCEHAWMFGNAKVCGNVVVCGNKQVYKGKIF